MTPASATPAAPNSSISLFGLYRLIWAYVAGVRLRYLGAMALLTSAQLTKLAVPWLAAQAINSIQQSNGGSLAHAGLMIAAVFGVYVLAWCMHGPGRVIERTVGLKVRASITDALYAKLASLPLGWHEKHHSGEVQHRMNQASRGLYDFAQTQFIYLQNLINLLGPLFALMLLSKTTGAIAMVGYVMVGAAIVSFDRVLMKLAAQENDAERRYASGVLDFLGNIGTVLSLRLQQASRSLIGQRLAKVFVPLRRSIVVTEAKWCAVDLLSIGLTWTLVIAYAWQTKSAGGTLLLGGVFMVYQYAQQAGGVIGAMASHFQNFSRIRTDVASADMIWNAEPRGEGGGDASKDWQEIGIRGLEFTYQRENGERGGIEDATLTIRRGERIAFIGPSGGGKSTLMRLMAGLYEPQRGVYSVDGVSHVDLHHLAGIATLIPQEAEVFEATVRDNITFGVTVDQDDLRHAARLSCFDAVVDAMPQGYDTPLSERGVNLSGGQRQRLSLARGLLAAQHSSIVLLDEPTSALDQLTETRVFARLRELRNTTVIASVHRMSLLQHFDRVVLMAAGRVVDIGTVEELNERQVLFREMVYGAAGHQDTTTRTLAA